MCLANGFIRLVDCQLTISRLLSIAIEQWWRCSFVLSLQHKFSNVSNAKNNNICMLHFRVELELTCVTSCDDVTATKRTAHTKQNEYNTRDTIASVAAAAAAHAIGKSFRFHSILSTIIRFSFSFFLLFRFSSYSDDIRWWYTRCECWIMDFNLFDWSKLVCWQRIIRKAFVFFGYCKFQSKKRKRGRNRDRTRTRREREVENRQKSSIFNKNIEINNSWQKKN